MIDDLSFFQQVATRASLTEVARQMGLSLLAVSKRLSQMGFGRRHLAPVVSSFATLHPELEISLELTSQPLSLLDDQFDIGVCMGEPPDSRLIGIRLLENPRLLCASPRYLESRPAPVQVADLAQHNCIVLRQFGSDYAIWRFHKNGQDYSHKVSGTLSSNDGEVALSLALEGHGLILRSRWDVQEHLESGRLRVVLEDYQAPRGDIFAVYQHRRHIPQRISTFAQYMAQALERRLPFAAPQRVKATAMETLQEPVSP